MPKLSLAKLERHLYSRKAGLPESAHFHSLRHTCASWLIEAGEPIVYVKEILGHSSITTTMIYAHAREEHLRDAVQRLDGFIEQPRPGLRLIG
jgi:site-specific recombinase XerD